mmetsp:Transcript_71306/g.153879  ORF Transcript_71306/g.153879 Transcript_71306/m.153879 type:complete len:232 (+) Transcript_71306:1774-2469(+)
MPVPAQLGPVDRHPDAGIGLGLVHLGAEEGLGVEHDGGHAVHVGELRPARLPHHLVLPELRGLEDERGQVVGHGEAHRREVRALLSVRRLHADAELPLAVVVGPALLGGLAQEHVDRLVHLHRGHADLHDLANLRLRHLGHHHVPPAERIGAVEDAVLAVAPEPLLDPGDQHVADLAHGLHVLLADLAEALRHEAGGPDLLPLAPLLVLLPLPVDGEELGPAHAELHGPKP